MVDVDDDYPLNPNVHTAPTGVSAEVELELLPTNINTISGSLDSTSQDNRPVTFSVVTQATEASNFSLDAASGDWSYSTTSAEGVTDVIQFIVNDGFVDSAPADLAVKLMTDPLYQYQWNIENRGQTNFATIPGTEGEDVNATQTILDGLRGEGITIAVVDDGLEIEHEDLASNVVVDGSYDFIDGDNDPAEVGNEGGHGTSVAGIIAATGWNNKGVRGIAPASSLKGFNYLASAYLTNYVASFGGEEYSADVDVFNFSAGQKRRYFGLSGSTEQTVITSTVPSMRNGKGAIWVKSAGNYFNGFSDDEDRDDYREFCGSRSSTRLSCSDAIVSDTQHIWPTIILTASLGADGVKASYSSPGASLWISGFGGEYGRNQSFGGYSDATVAANPSSFEPATMTTDKSGCSRGYVSDDDGNRRYNAFNDDRGPHPENPGCNYVSTFNGTSAAAPTVAGSIALILQANPDLTYRDVKHILASTARKVDEDFMPVAVDGQIYYQWVTNSAGYTFHNWYGFGAIDADAAVLMAKSYQAGSLGSYDISLWEDHYSDLLSVELGEELEYESVLASSLVGKVEYVRVRIKFDAEVPSSVGLRLMSPAGTIVTLLQPHTNVDTNPGVEQNVYLAASVFYGESIAGDWTLLAMDHDTDEKLVTIADWAIKFFYR